MALPGKILIALLEEDDPQRSFFRLKPIMVEENGEYTPYCEEENFPEDGWIRIVPDKAEAVHFKNRMRQSGNCVIVDLRDHPSENNKIRLNKNYQPGGKEHNAYIIYSDVVRKPYENELYTILSLRPEEAENALLDEKPDTEKILLMPEESLYPDIYTCEKDPYSNCLRLKGTDERVDLSQMQTFMMVEDNMTKLNIAVRRPPVKASPDAERVRNATTQETGSFVKPEALRKERIQRAEAPTETAARKPEAKTEWVETAPPLPREMPRFSPHMSPRQISMAQQCGLNPRRGLSIKEIIDEKWCESRLDQLGMSAAIATDGPALNDAQRIIDTLHAMWHHPEQRETIVNAITDMEGLEEAMKARRKVLRDSAVSAQLTELEARRLQMLDELEDLRKGGEALRNTLKAEIRREEAEAFADAVEKTKKAQAEQTRLIKENEALREQSESAKEAIAALTDGRFEERLNDYLINRHAADLLEVMGRKRFAAPRGETVTATAEELIQSLTACFETRGISVSRQQAINLLICAAQSPMLLFSGAPGSGKSLTAECLAKALGMDKAHCLRYAADEKAPLGEEALNREDDLPMAVILEDANLCHEGDMMRGLSACMENENTMLWLTLQDGGEAVPTYLYDRAFTLRLSNEAYDSVWQGSVRGEEQEIPTLDAAALRKAFAPQMTELPDSVNKRMEKLRGDLGLMGVSLSARSLRAAWDYCAAAIPLMSIEPVAVLDMAICERILPTVLAGAPIAVLKQLP